MRTTHLTGITTDLGIGLIRLWTDRHHLSKRDDREFFATQFRLGIIGSFILGSIMGAFLFQELKFLGFLIPFIISSYVIIKLMRKLT